MTQLPTLPSPLADRFLQVDHAGEQGAICVYRAQRAVAALTAPTMRRRLNDFLLHEKRHRSMFGAALMRRGLPRARSYLLCSAGGYILGVLTGLLGRRAIAATTMALESEVIQHLVDQRQLLADVDPEAADLIASIVEDEQLNHDRSLDQVDLDRSWLQFLGAMVRRATRAAIWLGMKL